MLLGNRERGDSLVELALIKIGPGSEQLRFCTNILERRGQLAGSRFLDISLNLAKILSPFLETIPVTHRGVGVRQALRRGSRRRGSNLLRCLEHVSVLLGRLLVASTRLERGCSNPIEDTLRARRERIIGRRWEPYVGTRGPQPGLAPVRQANQQVRLTE